jgi:DNA/RNA-binding domain of Phe-tRNA-synthetase-like protein
MTVEEIVTEVSRDMGMPEQLIEDAKTWARITAVAHRRFTTADLNEEDTHVVRMYFRTLLYRIGTDPEFRRELKAELKRRVERN